jgi:hypothetical protein
VFAIGIIGGFYTLYPLWKPYPPLIFDGSMFWILIPAALFNIFPCVNIGKVDTGRLWFHHYVYGFVVAGVSTIVTALTAPAAMPSLFTSYITDIDINIGRFFIVGGLTLVIDDLADVSKRLRSALRAAKSKASQNGITLHTIQFLMGLVALYFLVAVVVYLAQNPVEVTLANAILLGTLLVTVLTSFANVKRKVWLNIGTGTIDTEEAS